MELVRDKRVKDAYMVLSLLGMFRRGELRKDHPLQRKADRWDTKTRDGIIATVLKNEDIDSIKMCEELVDNCVILWLIDGLQRLTTLESYKNCAFKLGKNIEFPIITFQKSTVVDGTYVYENVDYDIRGKKYSDLPVELKERFDNYKINIVKHLDCTEEEIGYHIRRYNQQKSMNTTESAITYMDNIACYVKDISKKHSFFKDCGTYTEKERGDGTIERIIVESIMCMFHLHNWKKQTKSIGIYLKNNSSDKEFEKLGDNLTRLEMVSTVETQKVFTAKDSYIWFTLFDKFTELDVPDVKFAEFIEAFNGGLKSKEVDGVAFEFADKGKGTKDKSVILSKLHILETLMYEFLDINDNDLEEIDVLEFLNETVSADITEEDVEFYEENLNAWSVGIKEDSYINSVRNRPSMIAIAGYITNMDDDAPDDEILINWFADFGRRNDSYIRNQKENFEYMKKDLENYMERGVKNESPLSKL